MANECSFCGKELKPATGKIFVRDNGQSLYFCSTKCEKNQIKLGRDNRKFKWTKAAQEIRAEVKKLNK